MIFDFLCFVFFNVNLLRRDSMVNRKTRWSVALLGLCLVLAFGMIAQDVNAQALYGSLTGSVKDTSGGAIPGVEVHSHQF